MSLKAIFGFVRGGFLCLFCLGSVFLFPRVAAAEILFESGTLGPTGIAYGDLGGGTEPGSSGVRQEVFSGVRFEISNHVHTTSIGGHFVADPRISETSFFGALIRLDNGTDFPDSGDLSTPDVLGATLLTFPHPSAEAFADLEITLDPGWYALVFGSGLFGANGGGAAILNNPDVGDPSYIGHQTASGWLELSPPFGPFENYRLVVRGRVIPEPTSIVIAFIGIACLLGGPHLARISPRVLQGGVGSRQI